MLWLYGVSVVLFWGFLMTNILTGEDDDPRPLDPLMLITVPLLLSVVWPITGIWLMYAIHTGGTDDAE